jgi:hypothetical protein
MRTRCFLSRVICEGAPGSAPALRLRAESRTWSSRFHCGEPGSCTGLSSWISPLSNHSRSSLRLRVTSLPSPRRTL